MVSQIHIMDLVLTQSLSNETDSLTLSSLFNYTIYVEYIVYCLFGSLTLELTVIIIFITWHTKCLLTLATRHGVLQPAALHILHVHHLLAFPLMYVIHPAVSLVSSGDEDTRNVQLACLSLPLRDFITITATGPELLCSPVDDRSCSESYCLPQLGVEGN
jgi:hypothetical protein